MTLKNKMRSIFCAVILGVLSLHQAALAKEPSLFDMTSEWQTDEGKKVPLKQLNGKQIFLTMAYTNCHSACPLIVEQLKKLSDQAKAKKIDAHFVIVSLDPARDTWQTLKHFKTNMKIDRPGWTMLVGDDASTRQLSVALGLHYSKVPDSAEILHDNLIVLLDKEGRIVRKVAGLKTTLADFEL